MWELIFLLLILKIPIVYLCAGRLVGDQGASRVPHEGAALSRRVEPPIRPCDWRRRAPALAPTAHRGPRRGPRRRRRGTAFAMGG